MSIIIERLSYGYRVGFLFCGINKKVSSMAVAVRNDNGKIFITC